jgi:hypothetical protein
MLRTSGRSAFCDTDWLRGLRQNLVGSRHSRKIGYARESRDAELEDPTSDSRLTSVRGISVPFYSQSILQEFEKCVG